MRRENEPVGFRTLWGYLREVGRELTRPAAWLYLIIALVLATKALEIIRMQRGQPPLFADIFQPVLRAIGGFVADPDAVDRYLRRVPAFFYQFVLPFGALWFWFVISNWQASGRRIGRALGAGLKIAWNDFGLSPGCLRQWWKTLVIIFCFMLPFIYAFATTEGFRRHYPYLQRLRSERVQMGTLARQIESRKNAIAGSATRTDVQKQDPAAQAAHEKARTELAEMETRSRSVFWGALGLLVLFEFLRMLYMLSWEFFFRGFMLQGLLRLGLGWHAVWIQMLPYVLLHSTKPGVELYYTIPSGVLLGVLAWKSGSIWPGFVLHFAGAVVFDVCAMFA